MWVLGEVLTTPNTGIKQASSVISFVKCGSCMFTNAADSAESSVLTWNASICVFKNIRASAEQS